MVTELEEALGQLSLHTLLAAAIVASGGTIVLNEDDFVDDRTVGHRIGLTWNQEARTISLSLEPDEE